MSVSLDWALEVLKAVREEAERIGVPMVAAVVDAGGNTVALQRMDGSLLVSLEVALDKAYTAAAVRLPTHELGMLAQPGAPLFGIHATGGGRIVVFGGGVPLRRDEDVVGGLGVSGGTVEQDLRCARAGEARFDALAGG